MISQEFKSAVANKNLLRTRIMLKDSFVVDPTFTQLREMLSYAKRMLPDLMVPFDDDPLEEDQTKWNHEVMNMELVQLVNNFSETRIAHLQKVVSKVIAPEIARATMQRSQPQCFLQALFPQKCRLTSSKLHGEFPQYCISPSGTLLGAGEEPLQAYKVY